MTANDTTHPTASELEIDASCRVPLLALLVGASVWLVLGTVLAVIASIKFHAPDFLADCPLMTYGRVQAAANDALVYGFCLPAALGVILWIFSRLSQTVFALPVVPVVAAHIWHLGVFVGLVSVLLGNSTGFAWLEFPRGGSVLILVAFLLIAISAVATLGFRLERALNPAHWFLLAALLWFPWSYSSANIFLVALPVRGVAQAVIDLWFGNNLLWVWFSLTGLGIGFFFLPKLTGRPLHTYYYALYVFWTLILFGTWCGIPAGSPFPAWIPVLSSVAATFMLVPFLGVAILVANTICGACQSSASSCEPKGGPLCYFKFGFAAFILSGLLLVASACPRFGHVTEFTWFGQAQVQLQIFGFLAMFLFGAIYYILPRALGFDFRFPKFTRFHFWAYVIGVILYVIPLAIAGYLQGSHAYDPAAALPALRISTLGLNLILLGNLLFALNIISMFVSWKLALAKTIWAAVTAPLKTAEVKP
jgi:cytochrome c oxidase cbb3-type subunit 1